MKRSDMIKLLFEYYDSWEDYPSSEEIAKYSLDLMEKAGMVPPPLPYPKTKDGGIKTAAKSYVWEPENEKE